MLVGGFTLINCRVAEHHVVQDQDSASDAASRFFVYVWGGRMRDSELRSQSKQNNNSLTT